MRAKTGRIAWPVYVIVLLSVLSGCAKSVDEISGQHTFRNIPGISADEIRAIETFQKEKISFVYGMTPSMEAFHVESGEIGGFASLFCDWLTDFFGISFTLTICDWDDLITGLAAGRIDFTGELTASEERRKTYFMTDAIASRPIKYFRIKNSPALEEIARSRPLRYALMEGATTVNVVQSALVPGTYESIYASNRYAAYNLLKSGEVDAIITESAAEAYFDIYGDVVSSDFYPLTFEPVSMSTQNPAFEPIVSVTQKMLRDGGIRYLANLYTQGYRNYIKHKMYLWLNDEEREYIRDNPVIPVAAEHDIYPISFFNKRENAWQGIFFDLLDEIELLTGLSFKLVHDEHTTWPVIYEMLLNKKAAFVPELFQLEERKGLFLWPETAMQIDYYALISKSSAPNITTSEIPYVKIGLTKNTAYTAMFNHWFPNHMNTVEYEGMEEVFDALQRGEVDMVMATRHRLLHMTNYLELPGYKVNVMFDYSEENKFGFNRDEEILCSIIDKALSLINTKGIADQWIWRTYDYRLKLAEARLPWFIGAFILLLCILILVFILFQKTSNVGKKLEGLVKKHTAELRHALTTLDAVTKNYKGIIWSVDINGIVTSFRGQFVKTIGVEPSLVEGKSIDLARQTNKHLDIIEHVENTFVVGPQDWISDIDGNIFHSYTTPMYDGENNITGVVGSTDDVTELIKLQRDMETAVKTAEAASASKTRFLANMSHEIRTPMNAILGTAEIQLQRQSLEPETEEALIRIYDSGDLLLNIINDILDLSKIEAGKLELIPAKYDTASLINDTVSLNMVRMDGKPIEFELSVDENIPAVLIGDKLRIKQILNNLLSNAFKYTTKGTVKLSISAERENKEAGSGITLICRVSDTGQGLTKDQIDKLFNEYYLRFNMDANRTTEGTGLGLNITNNLVKLMNGNIAVESEPNRGSTFTVYLPQQTNGAGPLGKELVENLQNFELNGMRQTRKTQIVFEPMPYGKVLVVDDVESNLYVAKGLMAPYGLTIETAMSGVETINKINAGKVYDIIFMDHMMPEMDGIETVQKIRELKYTHPVIALTANAVVGQAEIFLKSGFDGFVSKPVDIRQLDMMLKQFIRDKQPPEVIAAANRQKSEYAADDSAKERLAEIFIRDASKAIETLETIHGRNTYDDSDIRAYTITVHAMKSALANIGETEFSSAASRLEEAARANNTKIMSLETPALLDALWAIVKKLTPQKKEGLETADEDIEYLREKLLVIKTACEIYDRKTAKTAIAELREKSWTPQTRELLEAMSGYLLDGDFKEVENLAGGILQ